MMSTNYSTDKTCIHLQTSTDNSLATLDLSVWPTLTITLTSCIVLCNNRTQICRFTLNSMIVYLSSK